jgi:hypothetical protein
LSITHVRKSRTGFASGQRPDLTRGYAEYENKGYWRRVNPRRCIFWRMAGRRIFPMG